MSKKKVLGLTVAALAAIGIGNAAAGGSSGESSASASADASQSAEASLPAGTPSSTGELAPDISALDISAPAISAPEPAAAPEQPSGTVAQQNAIRSAESYLEMSGFSRAGLIKQLSSEYGEGFSVEDATYAVDHITVDWNAEAVESAQSYLEMSGFSRAGLIDQLSSEYGEQFTPEQAAYAADQVGL
jgi:hypothetical protein